MDTIAVTLKNKLYNFRRNAKKELVRFYMRKKKDKIKLTVFHHDLEKGRLCRMTDIDEMFTALRLAWIPRLLNAGDKNWRALPNRYLRKQELYIWCYIYEYFWHIEMCCQILQGEDHYAMNARISILPDDKCYLLSEGLVNLTRVWHSPFLYQTF